MRTGPSANTRRNGREAAPFFGWQGRVETRWWLSSQTATGSGKGMHREMERRTVETVSPSSGTLRIDAHQHFWDGKVRDRSLAPHRVFSEAHGPGELHTEFEAAGITGSVLIQSRNAPEENEAMASLLTDAPFVRGVVYYAPLSDQVAAPAAVEAAASLPRACGLRYLVARDPLAWASAPGHRRIWQLLVEHRLCFEVVPITAAQIEAIIDLARGMPELRIVVDHLARPPVREGGFEPWASLVARLAAQDNVAMKLSVGVDVLESWKRFDASALRPYVAHALEHFGEDRLLLASNWPVVLMRTSYSMAWSGLCTVLDDLLGASEGSPIFGAAAASWFGLEDRQ